MKRKAVKKGSILVVSIALIMGIIGAVIWRVKLDSASSDVASFVLLSDGFTDRRVTDQESALAAVSDVADELGIRDVNSELYNCKKDTISGNTYYRFYQEYEGIPVYGRSVVVLADEHGNGLLLSGNYLSIDGLNISSSISEADAIKSADQYYDSNAEIVSDGMVIYSLNGHKPELVWKLYVNSEDTMLCCFISTQTGKLLKEHSLTYFDAVEDTSRDIHVYDAQNSTLEVQLTIIDSNGNIYENDSKKGCWVDQNEKPVMITNNGDCFNMIIYDANNNVRGTGGEYAVKLTTSNIFTGLEPADSSSQKAVKVLSEIENTYNYYETVLKRHSFDGAFGAINVCVNDYLRGDTDNAKSYSTFNLPITVLTFGTDNTLALDVVAHEFTHSVSKCIVDWAGNNETDSINEALSDIFGETIEAYTTKQEPNWENPYRNIWSPGGSCISDYSAYNDSLDCHHASTLVSHAAYLMYNGISGNNPNFEALTTENLAHLFYETLYIMPSDCSFSQFRTLVQNTAEIMYCQGRLSYKQVLCVSNAFFQVGITPAISPVAKHLSLDVYGIDGLPYENYRLSVRHYGGAEKTYSGDTIKSEGGISFPTIGNYELCIVDNANADNKTSFTVRVVENGGATRIPVFTQCGVAKPNGPIESEINQPSEIDIPVSLLSHDPFNDHKMQFGLTEYEVSGGIRETDGNYNTYMDLPDFPVIVSISDDFGHDGDILQLTIGGKEYKNDKYLAIDFSSEDRKGHHYLLRLGDWAGESVYCYISHGANTDYLVMEKLSPTSSAVGSETFYIGRANGCFQEEIWIISLNDFSDVKYTLDYEREYEAFTIREEASDLEWGRYLCCQDGVNFIYNNDSLYDSYDEAMEHIKERLSKYGLEDRVSLDKTNDSQSTNITPLFLEHQNGIQRDVALASVSDLTLDDIMIFGVNPELSSGNSLVTEPEESTSIPDNASLLGTWDSNDGEMRLILNSTGSDMAFTKDGIKNASGSITIIDLKKGEKHLGAYIIGSNTITIVLDLNEYEMYYSFDNSTLIIGEKELHRMDNALISQLIGTWEGDGLKIYFGKDNDVTLYEKSRTRHGLYAVLSESEVLINVDGYAVNTSNYSVNGTTLNFNSAVLYKDGADTSYATISSFADKVIGDWKACNDETGSYYVFTADGNYEYYSMEGIFHPTLSGCYEIVSENELHLVYDQYSYSVLTLESDDLLEDSGGRKYTKVK